MRDGSDTSSCSPHPDVHGLENLHSPLYGSESVLRMCAGPAGGWSPGPLVLLADTEALSRGIRQLAPTGGSTVLSLTSGGLLDKSDSKSEEFMSLVPFLFCLKYKNGAKI